MLIIPGGAQPIRDLLHNLPVRAAALGRLENLVQPLDAPFRAGEGTFFLQARTRGQHYVGESAGRAEKDILDLIRQLSPGYRTVFNMYVVEGYTHKEIGDILGISEGTSKSQLSRAKVILQDMVKNFMEQRNEVKAKS